MLKLESYCIQTENRAHVQQTFDKYELQLGNVLRRPIDGLIAYHVANK